MARAVYETKRTNLLVELSGDHKKIGYEHGQRCAREINRLREVLMDDVTRKSGLDPSRVMSLASKFRPVFEKHAPHLMEEIEGIAEGSGLPVNGVIFLNTRHEMTYELEKLPKGECSAVAFAPEHTAAHETLIGQNVDHSKPFEPLLKVFRIRPKTGPSILTITFAGTVGQVGVNSYGVARVGNGLNNLHRRPVGVSRYALNRLVLEQENVQDATRLVTESERGSGGNFLLGAANGDIIDIETTSMVSQVLKPTEGWLAHSNHFIGSQLKDAEARSGPKLDDTQTRLSTLEKFAKSNTQVTAKDLKRLFRDHSNYPTCICRHAESYSQTIASAVIEPNARSMSVLTGNPCEEDYVRYSLN